MRSSVTVQSRFSAGHLTSFRPCDTPHGHDWSVEVTLEGAISRTGAIDSAVGLGYALSKLAASLDHRDLNSMVPAVIPVPEGLAVWFREQLLLLFPAITRVRVGNGDYSATAEWEIR